MPRYLYRCANCGHHMEVLKKMEDAASVEFCPRECAKFQPMERVYDAPAAKISGGTPRFHQRRVRA